MPELSTTYHAFTYSVLCALLQNLQTVFKYGIWQKQRTFGTLFDGSKS